MRDLAYTEIQAVSGAVMDPVLIGLTSVLAGSVSAYTVSCFPKLSTIAGTISMGATGAVLGTLAFPIVGTFFGGCVGGLTGYMVSSTLAPVATFASVGTLTAVVCML